MQFSKLSAAAAAAALLLTGCSSVSLDESAKEGTLAGEETAQTAVNPFTDPANPLSQRSVYFAFDSYDVSQQYLPYVEAHAEWLRAHPDVKIVIQGNGTVVLTGLKIGDYTVTEDTAWSWRYTPRDGAVRTIPLQPGKTNSVTYVNNRTNNKWLDGNAYVKNVFGTIIETDSGI